MFPLELFLFFTIRQDFVFTFFELFYSFVPFVGAFATDAKGSNPAEYIPLEARPYKNCLLLILTVLISTVLIPIEGIEAKI